MGKFGKGLKTVSSRTMTGGKGRSDDVQKAKKMAKKKKKVKKSKKKRY